ncbi:MAG: Nif3-like dinuclear metal center hexameric protein [Jatrophihabitantaceae bacterium]
MPRIGGRRAGRFADVPALAEIIDVLNGWFDPQWAASWDAVGLVCGDPHESVERMLLAVDPAPATVDEATGSGSQLLLTHHPLLLTAVHGVPADDPKGALVHRMIRAGLAHFVVHTNADVARPGVSDALAQRLGIVDLRPLIADLADPLAKLTVFVPTADVDRFLDAMAASGAGTIGDYERCAWSTTGTGTFRPLPGATPTIGAVNEVVHVGETRLEMVLPPHRRDEMVAALRAAHPYEQPAFDFVTHVALPSDRGTGRIGTLAEPMSLRVFTKLVAHVLPATSWGVRAAGNPDRMIGTVAVCGGSGGSYAEVARRAGADVFVTADLKHHSTIEAVTELGGNGMALVDAAHWATEAPWLDAVAARLMAHFDTTVEVRVSRIVTDPWTLHAPSSKASLDTP